MVDASKFINPVEVIKEIDLKEGMYVADFGSGTGVFTLQMAKIVGDKGKVYAIDVLKEALESIRGRASLENILNIEAIRGNLEVAGGSKISESSVDLVLMANMLFQSKKRVDIFKEANRILKKGGRVVIIDWLPEKAITTKSGGWAVSEMEAEKDAEEVGFKKERSFLAGLQHYGIIFKKV